jgi:hypothetical protein
MDVIEGTSTDKRIDDLRAHLDQRFDDARAHADQRFGSVEQRLGSVEQRLGSVERRFDGLYKVLLGGAAAIIAALIGLIATQL